MIDFEIDEVEEIEYLGEIEDYFYDVGMIDTPHTFFANDILVHNSLYLHGGAVLDSINYPHSEDIEKGSEFLDKKISPMMVKVIDSEQKRLAMKAMNCPDCKIIFKREMVARRGTFLAKKRYVAWVIIGEDGPVEPGNEHEIEVKGLESVRSSTPEYIRDKLVDFYKIYLQTKDLKCVNDYVKGIYTSMVDSDPDSIAKYSNANNIAKYTTVTGEPDKGTPFHVKGCIAYNSFIKRLGLENDYEEIFEGDKVKVLYIKQCTAFPDYSDHVISYKNNLPTEFGVIPDYNIVANKVWVEPLRIFYELMGWQLPSFETEDIEDLFG